MKKKDELNIPGSCWNKAAAEEYVFVLLGRDAAAPATIRFWAGERIRQGKNKKGDMQLSEALHTANRMESAQVAKLPPIKAGVEALLNDVNNRLAGMSYPPEYLKQLHQDLSAALKTLDIVGGFQNFNPPQSSEEDRADFARKQGEAALRQGQKAAEIKAARIPLGGGGKITRSGISKEEMIAYVLNIISDRKLRGESTSEQELLLIDVKNQPPNATFTLERTYAEAL